MVFPLRFDFHVYAVIGAFQAVHVKKTENFPGLQLAEVNQVIFVFVQNCVFHPHILWGHQTKSIFFYLF
jgi:hypothetical protein